MNYILPVLAICTVAVSFFIWLQSPPSGVVRGTLQKTQVSSISQKPFDRQYQTTLAAIDDLKHDDPELHNMLAKYATEIEKQVRDAEAGSGKEIHLQSVEETELFIKEKYKEAGLDYDKETEKAEKIITAKPVHPEIKRIYESFEKGIDHE